MNATEEITVGAGSGTIRVGDILTIEGVPKRGMFRSVWDWLRGRDLEDGPKRSQFVVTRCVTSTMQWGDA